MQIDLGRQGPVKDNSLTFNPAIKVDIQFYLEKGINHEEI